MEILKQNFNIISDKEWYPLQIREHISSLDRDIAFLKEIVQYTNGILYIDTDTINNNANIYNYISKNLLKTYYISKNLYKADILIIDKLDNNINLNYKIIISTYKLNNTTFNFNNKYITVHHSIYDQFCSYFKYYINKNNLEYDNLINLLIMVKNAGDGFRNILQQNLPYIDTWTILDTGSTDNTIEIIKEELKNKKGVLYQEPFINFRDSRNRLLELAGDNCVFNIMLDDTYIIQKDLRNFLTIVRSDDFADSYSIFINDGDIEYSSNRITKSNKKLKYEYIIHEIIESNTNVSIPKKYAYIQDICSPYMKQRTKTRKTNDLCLLYRELETVKTRKSEARITYYLAETYLCLENWNKAYDYYKVRSKLNEKPYEEIQDSLYKMAYLSQEYLQKDWSLCHQMYLDCYNYDINRPESLFVIGKYFLEKGYNNVAYMYLKQAYDIGIPSHKKYMMNLKMQIYKYYIPKLLLKLCYLYKNYKLGQNVLKKF